MSEKLKEIIENMPKDVLINSFETVYEDSIKKDLEIEKLNNIINELSKENQELKEKTKLFHKNRVFSLEYDKETLTDMVLEYQEKIDKAIEYIDDLCKCSDGTYFNYGDDLSPKNIVDILKENK